MLEGRDKGTRARKGGCKKVSREGLQISSMQSLSGSAQTRRGVLKIDNIAWIIKRA